MYFCRNVENNSSSKFPRVLFLLEVFCIQFINFSFFVLVRDLCVEVMRISALNNGKLQNVKQQKSVIGGGGGGGRYRYQCHFSS